MNWPLHWVGWHRVSLPELDPSGNRDSPATVKRLLYFFIQLCLLRVGPQDLPAAWVLLWLLLPINLLVGILLIGDSLGGLDKAFAAALIDLLVMLGWTSLLLNFKRHRERFVQTLTSLLGVGILIGCLALPLQLSLADVTGAGDLDFATQLLSMLLLFVMVWSILVSGHVYRHALDVSLGLGMGLALSYSVIITLVIGLIFPASGG